MTDSVKLKVNEEALVRHLKFGFTHQATVLGETRAERQAGKSEPGRI